jgi:arylsulfatase A-like enzyme
MRVPLIASWARRDSGHPSQQQLPIAAGAIQSQVAAVYDLFPTILGVAGTASPPEHVVDGTRLDVLLTGQYDSGREEVFLMHYPHAPHRTDYFTCYRAGAWKVIYHYRPTDVSDNSHYQLFDLARDPFEQRNLAASHPVELRRMMEAMVTALEQHAAAYPVGDDGVTPLVPKLP